MKVIELALVVFDASTQARAAIDEAVVAQYAEQMLNGVQFPPVDVFHDGNRYYMGDGFHRGLAAQRNGAVTIPATVHAGTREDALWFALGANKTHGHQMTVADKRHAILLALKTWPDRSATHLAEQIGCSDRYVLDIKKQVRTTSDLPDRVTGKDGKSYPASRPTEHPRSHPKTDEIAERLRAGEKVHDIGKALGVAPTTVTRVRQELGIQFTDKSQAAVIERWKQAAAMAADGYTSRQIAAKLGITEYVCRATLRERGIDVPADRAVGNAKHHDSNRILDHMVADAEHLTADVNLIAFGDLDAERLGEWIDSLIASRKSLDIFIKRLIQEQKKHGEAA